MDIENILENQSAELLDIDLAALEEELLTGNYERSYVVRCREKIQSIRGDRVQQKYFDQVLPKRKAQQSLANGGLTLDANELSPFGHTDVQPRLSEGEQFERKLEQTRRADKPAAELKKFLNENPQDEDFIGEHLNSFTAVERPILLDCYSFSEGFLEKFFNVFRADDIAKTQHFSEEFFMKHYGELDPKVVLLRGVNEWRAKDARSQKLDVFLRLKGVHF